MENKLGQEPAFPNGMEVNNGYGMSKRFYAACAAMQGILSNEETAKIRIDTVDEGIYKTVSFAYKLADELLKQENK